jgi:hypothetical protein
MNGNIIRLSPPNLAERIRHPSNIEPLEGRIIAPAPISIFDSATNSSGADSLLIWKISAALALSIIALVLLVTGAFIFGAGYDISASKKVTFHENMPKAAETPVLLITPSKSPPLLPNKGNSLNSRPAITGQVNVDAKSLPSQSYFDPAAPKRPTADWRHTPRKMSMHMDSVVEGTPFPKENAVVNSLEITHADGETTIYKIGKVDKFKPKENGNVQE